MTIDKKTPQDSPEGSGEEQPTRSPTYTRDQQPLPKSPPGWGNDALTAHLDAVRQNQFATFVHRPSEFALLSEIDRCFLLVGEGWVDPPSMLAALLLIRSHVAYRGACGHALSGAAAETYPLVRSCLEYAGYALLIHGTPEKGEVWVSRHDDEAALQAVRSNFSVGKVQAAIAAANADKARAYKTLYDRSIDFGAHPNIHGLASNMKIIEKGKDRIVQIVYLHTDGVQMQSSLKTTAQAGVCALEIFQEAFPERFQEMGVTDTLARVRQHL